MTPNGNDNGGHLLTESVDVKQVHSNLSQEVVKITVDKLRLILNSYLENMERKREWMAPIGILATLVAVFATTNFKDFWLSAKSWEAFFLWGTLFTIIWLILSIKRALKAKSVDDVIEVIKSGEH